MEPMSEDFCMAHTLTCEYSSISTQPYNQTITDSLLRQNDAVNYESD